MKDIFLLEDDQASNISFQSTEEGGVAMHQADARTFDSGNQHSAEAFSYPPGGGAHASVISGIEFRVNADNGEQEEFCQITADVNYTGYLFALGGASVNATITLIVEDMGTGNIWDEDLLDEGGSAVSSKMLNENHRRKSVRPLLVAGNKYKAKIETNISSAGFTTGGATADFGQAIDYDPRGVKINHFEFEFDN